MCVCVCALLLPFSLFLFDGSLLKISFPLHAATPVEDIIEAACYSLLSGAGAFAGLPVLLLLLLLLLLYAAL